MIQGFVVGVDEAGRGPLAGPVYAAAVILPEKHTITGLKDSKKLTANTREQLFIKITNQAVRYAIAWADVAEIDTLNILRATFVAMQRAVAALDHPMTEILVDGHMAPKFNVPHKCIINGDDLEPCISAASILAKVARDKFMVELDALHPGYGFAKHKGYSTEQHLAALIKLGPSTVHRRSFAPVARAIK